MALGKPVIATNEGGNTELIIDKHSGFLIKPFDENELVEKIEILLADKLLRLNMGKSGRERIKENFSQDIMVDKYIDLYKEMLDENQLSGDISLNNKYIQRYSTGEKPFERIFKELKNSDLVIANLECISKDYKGENSLKIPRFTTNTEILNYLNDINTGLVSLAHNHKIQIQTCLKMLKFI